MTTDEHKAMTKRHLERAAAKLLLWAENPESDWAHYAFLDALGFCPMGRKLEDGAFWEKYDLRREVLSIDQEGYPRDDAGYTIIGADRKYVPLVRLEGDGA